MACYRIDFTLVFGDNFLSHLSLPYYYYYYYYTLRRFGQFPIYGLPDLLPPTFCIPRCRLLISYLRQIYGIEEIHLRNSFKSTAEIHDSAEQNSILGGVVNSDTDFFLCVFTFAVQLCALYSL